MYLLPLGLYLQSSKSESKQIQPRLSHTKKYPEIKHITLRPPKNFKWTQEAWKTTAMLPNKDFIDAQSNGKSTRIALVYTIYKFSISLNTLNTYTNQTTPFDYADSTR